MYLCTLPISSSAHILFLFAQIRISTFALLSIFSFPELLCIRFAFIYTFSRHFCYFCCCHFARRICFHIRISRANCQGVKSLRLHTYIHTLLCAITYGNAAQGIYVTHVFSLTISLNNSAFPLTNICLRPDWNRTCGKHLIFSRIRM